MLPIAETKRRLGTELRAALYLYNDEKFIVSSIQGISEYGDPIVLDADTSDEALGEAACNKLLDFDPKCKDMSKSKLCDWAAYNVSGAKSGRIFNSKSIYISIETVNSAIIINAAPRVSNEHSLKASCSTIAKHIEVGMEIRKSIKASKVLREAGML